MLFFRASFYILPYLRHGLRRVAQIALCAADMRDTLAQSNCDNQSAFGLIIFDIWYSFRQHFKSNSIVCSHFIKSALCLESFATTGIRAISLTDQKQSKTQGRVPFFLRKKSARAERNTRAWGRASWVFSWRPRASLRARANRFKTSSGASAAPRPVRRLPFGQVCVRPSLKRFARARSLLGDAGFAPKFYRPLGWAFFRLGAKIEFGPPIPSPGASGGLRLTACPRFSR